MKVTYAEACEILEITEEHREDQEVIRKSYKRLALQWHPDKNPDNPDAVERFQSISAAYHRLTNPEAYDSDGEEVHMQEDDVGFDDLMAAMAFFAHFMHGGGMRMGPFGIFGSAPFGGGFGGGGYNGGRSGRGNNKKGKKGKKNRGGGAAGGSDRPMKFCFNCGVYHPASDSEDEYGDWVTDDEADDFEFSYNSGPPPRQGAPPLHHPPPPPPRQYQFPRQQQQQQKPKVDEEYARKVAEQRRAWEERERASNEAYWQREAERMKREREELERKNQSAMKREAERMARLHAERIERLVQQLPRPTMVARGDNSITLSIERKGRASDVVDGKLPQDVFWELSYRGHGEGAWAMWSDSLDTAQAAVTGLIPGTKYAFRWGLENPQHPCRQQVACSAGHAVQVWCSVMQPHAAWWATLGSGAM